MTSSSFVPCTQPFGIFFDESNSEVSGEVRDAEEEKSHPAPSPSPHSLADALRHGDHQTVRKLLIEQGHDVRGVDERFVHQLQTIANGDLELEGVERLKEGLWSVYRDWNLSLDSRSATHSILCHVVALNCWLVSLQSETLCVVREKVDSLIDELDPLLIRGTRLGTLLQYTIRSLRNPNRRAASRPKFYKFVKEFRKRIRILMGKWTIEYRHN